MIFNILAKYLHKYNKTNGAEISTRGIKCHVAFAGPYNTLYPNSICVGIYTYSI